MFTILGGIVWNETPIHKSISSYIQMESQTFKWISCWVLCWCEPSVNTFSAGGDPKIILRKYIPLHRRDVNGKWAKRTQQRISR